MSDSNGVPQLYIFDMGDVVCGNVHCVPAMAGSISLSVEEFFTAAGVSPSGTATAASYNSGDVRALQEGTIGSDEFWERFEERAARLFPDRRVRLPRRADGFPEDLWGLFFEPDRDEAVVAIIKELASAGRRVVCGTNTLSAHYDKLRARGDYDCFHAVYASQMMRTIKPEANFWRLILAAEGFSAGEAFFIDDNESNVEAAAALGIPSHRFRNAALLRAELHKLGAFDE